MSAAFQSLVARAYKLLESGQREEALALARKAEAFDHHRDDDLATLVAWNGIGMIFFTIGYDKSAERAYSIAASGAAYLQDLGLQANVNNNLGQVNQRRGRFEEAKAQLAKAVSIREEIDPGSLLLAANLDNLGAVELSLGNYAAAEALHLRAAAIFTRLEGYLSAHVGTAIGNLGGLYEKQGHLERAEACRLRALYTHLRASGPLGSGTLLNAQELCSLYLRQGRTAEIDRLVEFLLSAGERDAKASYRFLAEMLKLLADKAFVQHRLDLSARLVTRAITLLESNEGPESPETLATRFQRAATYRALANLEDAESEFSSLLDAYSRRDDKLEVFRTTVELAKTYRDKGQKPLARELLERAVKKLQAGEVDDRDLLASALGNLAELDHHENRIDQARAHFRSALETLDDGSHLDWPWLTHGLGLVEYHVGNYLEAGQLLSDAKEKWIELHSADHPFVATCAASLALVRWSNGDTVKAFAAFREAIALRDDAVRRQLTLGSERQRLEYARDQQGDLSKVISFCLASDDQRPEVQAFAAEVMLRRKSRVLDGIAQTLRQAHRNTSDAVRDLLDRLLAVRGEIARLSGLRQTKSPTGAAGDLRKLRQEEEALETALSHEGALAEAGLDKVSLETVQNAIPEKAVLIEYVRYKKFEPTRDSRAPWRGLRYAAAVTVNGRAPSWFDLGPEEKIDAQVSKLRQLIDLSAPVKAVKQEAQSLIELLIAPLAEQAKGAEHWLVAPDGLINLAPFDVLLDTWVGLDKAPLISFLVTARDLIPRSEAPKGADILVLAAPDFDAPAADQGESGPTAIHRGADFASLPGTLEEARGIQRVFPAARSVTGSEASVAALKGLHAPLILHIATHGVFQPLGEPEMSWSTELLPVLGEVVFVSRQTRQMPDPMVYSGLVFAGANSGDGASGTGIVTAREIAGIDLLGTELVVLSACETGVGTIRDGEEFSGLRRAFGIAGARSQLTSLWAVDDVATAELMVTFYEQIRAGKPRTQALRAAQQAVRTSQAHPEWSHPAYWAAFELSGDWSPIALAPG